MEEIPEELNSWFLLKVNFAEHLEVAYIGNRVGANVLWMKIVEM